MPSPIDLEPAPDASGAAWLALTGAAIAAIVTPTLLAYNEAPSATFLNQAVALIGWGVFAAVLAMTASPLRVRLNHAAGALLAALAVIALAALAAWGWVGLPRALAWSMLGIVGAAAVAVWGGMCAARGRHAQRVFSAVCVAFVLAGVLSVAVGIIQVFAPNLADGNWVAASALPGRASGNLRQPNHLASLLLWSAVAAIWLGEAHGFRRIAAALGTLFVFGLVLSASRTGMVGVGMLALWGMLDRRLSKPVRVLLVLAPLAYALMWWGLSVWAHQSQQVFGGEARLAEGDISSSRFRIWSNSLELIRQHPWAGVGIGEFNFAWSLTPFPHRPVAFFDHTHNLPLQFAVEMGLPLTALVLALMGWALWRAFAAGARDSGPSAPMLRAAFLMVLMMAVHSMLEYPLWYAYFLLPTAFVFGFAVGGEPPAQPEPVPARGTPWVLLVGASLMVFGSIAAVYDFSRVVVIFTPVDEAIPLAERIERGRRSWFFSHHADYAAATTATRPSSAMPSFDVATHYLLDTRLMMAWATALAEKGDVERARHLAQRLREFRNEDSKPFFEACDKPAAADGALPFQCSPPTRRFDYRDFK